MIHVIYIYATISRCRKNFYPFRHRKEPFSRCDASSSPPERVSRVNVLDNAITPLPHKRASMRVTARCAH